MIHDELFSERDETDIINSMKAVIDKQTYMLSSNKIEEWILDACNNIDIHDRSNDSFSNIRRNAKELAYIVLKLIYNNEDVANPDNVMALIINYLVTKLNELVIDNAGQEVDYEKRTAELRSELFDTLTTSRYYHNLFTNEMTMMNKQSETDSTVDTEMLIPIKVMFNEPATIVFWSDGTKTVVKKQPKEKRWDAEKAVYAALIKRMCGRETLINIHELTSNNPKNGVITSEDSAGEH